jgi:hypothetical protein
MQRYAKIATFLLVSIFLFSGFIKLNDPIGTQLKLEEYFDVFSLDFPWMSGFWKFWIPYALILSIILSSLEVILAIALWFNYRTKQTIWLIFAILLFFSFLTFYSAYFNKVTDCGCFGETIKLSPWTSFGKDLLLIVLTVSLFFTKKVNQNERTLKIVLLSMIISVGLGIYSYLYLPKFDGLPYAIGENIPQNMKEREALKFSYVYQINGKETELLEMPGDTSAKFISIKAINEKEARPLITDYHLWAEGDTTDYTKESFKGSRVMVIVPNIHHTYSKAFSDISKLAKELEKNKIPVWLVSASTDAEVNELRHQYQLGFPALSADIKVLKTMIRSSPGIWILQDGIVKGKWSAFQLPSAKEIEERL